MENIDEHVKNLYLSNEYIVKNPSLHEEDSPWKVRKIIPLVDRAVSNLNRKEINLLDAGGGAGLILKAVSVYIEEKHGIKVNRFALDLSPAMLKIQKKNNPDLKKALSEDVCKTSLGDKEIDLMLVIDLLEHISNPVEALEEIKRISRFAIFKVPMEGNLSLRIWNFINRGKPRRRLVKTIGHINVYSFGKLKRRIEKHAGRVLDSYFTNVFDYYRNSKYYKNSMKLSHRSVNLVAAYVFKLSPRLCSIIFGDFAMILVKCY